MKKFEVIEKKGQIGSELFLNGEKIFSVNDINIQSFRDYQIRSIGYWENTDNKDFARTILLGAGYCCDGMVYVLKKYEKHENWTLYNAIRTEVSVSCMFPVRGGFQDLVVLGTACNGSGMRLICTEGHRHHDAVDVIEGLDRIMEQIPAFKSGKPIFDSKITCVTGFGNISIKAFHRNQFINWPGINITKLLERRGVDTIKTLELAKGFRCILT